MGAWLFIGMGLLSLVALVALYDVLREAGPLMILTPVLSVLAWTLVTVSHLIPIALAQELVPAYSSAASGDRVALATVFDTVTAASKVTNLAGDFVLWGVVVPMFSIAMLTTRALPRWIGWVGLVVGLGGWLGLLATFSTVVEGVSSVGFLAFFVFMLGTGVALVRLTRRGRSSLRTT